VSRASDGASGGVAKITVAQVPSRAEADLIAGLLISNGVRSVVSADDAGGQQPQLQIDGVRVLVARSDEAAARQLLADAQAAAAADDDDEDEDQARE
jgi:Putative prokaryotic signal transducing protein